MQNVKIEKLKKKLEEASKIKSEIEANIRSLKGTVGYKAFDKDLKCRGYQYKVGELHTVELPIELCGNGLHFCKNPADVWKFYSFNNENRFCKVLALGEVITEDDDSKSVTNELLLLEELSWGDMLDLVNSGNYNSGHRNSGNYNSGHRNSGNYNSGDYNSGHRNSGNYNSGNYNSGHGNSGSRNSGSRNSGNRNSGSRNSGDYNSGDYNSGYFNTDTPTLRLFNKDSGVYDMHLPDLDFVLQKWVSSDNMTDLEKSINPDYTTVGGYLKGYTYKEAWANAWIKLTKDDKMMFVNLPNFCPKIFEEITGICVVKEGLID